MQHVVNPTTGLRVKSFERCIGTIVITDGALTLMGGPEDYETAKKITSGLGNGTYEVYVTVKHIPGYGPRITSTRIEFITDEEIQWMEQQLLE